LLGCFWGRQFVRSCAVDLLGAFAAQAVEDGQGGYGAAGEKTGGHAEDQREIVLVEAVDDTDCLQDAESAEGDERDAFVGFLAPDG
jgi:hypothetical protein